MDPSNTCKCAGEFCAFALQHRPKVPGATSLTAPATSSNRSTTSTTSTTGSTSPSHVLGHQEDAICFFNEETQENVRAFPVVGNLLPKEELEIFQTNHDIQDLVTNAVVIESSKNSSSSTSSKDSCHQSVDPRSTGTRNLKLRASKKLLGLASNATAISLSRAETHLILYKSIALGMANKQLLTFAIESHRNNGRSDKFINSNLGASSSSCSSGDSPSSPTGKPTSPLEHHQKRSRSFMDTTQAQQIRMRNNKEIADLHENSNLYRQVRVCTNCFGVYSFLDTIRQLMQHDTVHFALLHKQLQLHHQQEVDAAFEQAITQQVVQKSKVYRRKANDTSMVRRWASPSSQAPSGTLPIVAVTPPNELPVSSAILSTSVSMPALTSPMASIPAAQLSPNKPIKSTSVIAPLLAPSATSTASIQDTQMIRNHGTCVGMDHYLRGQSKQIAFQQLESNQLFRQEMRRALAPTRHSTSTTGPASSTSTSTSTATSTAPTRAMVRKLVAFSRVLAVVSDPKALTVIHSGLSELEIQVETLCDPARALEILKASYQAAPHQDQQSDSSSPALHYDLVLIERQLSNDANALVEEPNKLRDAATPGALCATEFTKLLRQFEIQSSVAHGKMDVSTRQMVICVSDKTSAEDLRSFMDAGMDGCISKPVKKDALVQTVQTALVASKRARNKSRPGTQEATENANDPNSSSSLAAQVRNKRRKRRMEAAALLPFPPLLQNSDDVFYGVFQMDADTAIPFCVFGRASESYPGSHQSARVGTKGKSHAPVTFFNLVVVHDLFDTFEKYQILLQPLTAKYYGIQVLVWNYPGQAQTTWRHGMTLNNTYFASCLAALLEHVGPRKLAVFNDSLFYLMGLGFGGNIATSFCASMLPPVLAAARNVRALLLVNSFVHIDTFLAQFLHDTLKILACTPASRPDLPIYFHTRFCFSGSYLIRVTTPFALNLYTAVYNPITLEGRQALCQGALFAQDLRDQLHQVKVPILNVCSSQNGLVKVASQTQCILNAKDGNEVDCIGKVLKDYRKTCVLWFPSGHEVVQECKQTFCHLLEQLLTGFHELHEVPLGKMEPFQRQKVEGYAVTSMYDQSIAHPSIPKTLQAQGTPSFEDSYINQVLDKHSSGGSSGNDATTAGTHPPTGRSIIPSARSPTTASSMTRPLSRDSEGMEPLRATTPKTNVTKAHTCSGSVGAPSGHHATPSNQLGSLSPEKDSSWSQFQAAAATKSNSNATAAQKVLNKKHFKGKKPKALRFKGEAPRQDDDVDNQDPNQLAPDHDLHELQVVLTTDPLSPAFERITNMVYRAGDGSKIYPVAHEMPQVKEYMAWRVQRNQKRLARMNQMATRLQKAFRAYLTKQIARRMRRQQAALVLQRQWRARMARKKYKGMQREDWAVRLVQRNWRGKLGRDNFKQRMQQYLASVQIERMVRGFLARRQVHRLRRRLHQSAVRIQNLFRQFLAKKKAFIKRQQRNACLRIQRVFRGHLGRQRFHGEMTKLLFAKTQAQGITFGKQMLLEYKLFGTRLQSEVALLTKTKHDAEQDAEQLLQEICEFEQGVQLLEHEMHRLSQMESEVNGVLDEKAKWQLREQKMRLDREFALMLHKIADRKEKLATLEDKLQQLDAERIAKEEDLRGLERKLVVLLEEQQKELEQIKLKQVQQSLASATPPKSNKPAAAAAAAATAGGASANGGTTELTLDFQGMESSPSKRGSASMGSVGSVGSGSIKASSVKTHSTIAPNASSATALVTPQQREEANSLMQSTETMMKFGFMSMSMTYFSSMNMLRAMRKIGAHHMTLESAAVVSGKHWPENSASDPSSAVAATAAAAAAAATTGANIGASPFTLDSFSPAIPKGTFPGQQPFQIIGWSIADVGRWLDTLALGQYKRAFADAAVDGALLVHLNEEDLKNTLGMEHRLHRKKILTSVEQLKEKEMVAMKRLFAAEKSQLVGDDVSGGGGGGGGGGGAGGSPSRDSSFSPKKPATGGGGGSGSGPGGGGAGAGAGASDGATNASGVSAPPGKLVVSFDDLCTMVRHSKLKQLKEALSVLPDRRFDGLNVAQPFAANVGTLYDDVTEKSVFHINKSDDNGNSLLILAAQNNNLKVAQLLVAKGANPNHQNKHGQTAGHYAMAYSFFDLGAWLLDPDKGGGKDDILNENGLTPYDGL